jgi:dTDP-4-amino-4,6-dideoxygalactose transaminase
MTKKVPFLDLNRIHAPLKDDILASIGEIIDNNSFVLGEPVSKFEREFADYIGTEAAIGMSSGMDALKIALQVFGFNEGDEIITAANTFVATVFSITHSKLTPILVDCDPVTSNLDPAKIEAAITPKTKAIMPVHLYGQAADMDPIIEIAEKYSLKIIEDAAQAHGAKYKDRLCGTFGDLACFSFYPGKNLGAMGEGGAIVTSDPELDKIVRAFRDVGQTKKYHHQYQGHNFRLHSIQAAILSHKLPHLDTQNLQRREIANIYQKRLAAISHFELPKSQDHLFHIYHLYVITLKDPKERELLLEHLTIHNIGAGIHYPIPVNKQLCFSNYEFAKQTFPVAELKAQSILSLPIFPGMSEEEANYVCDVIEEYFHAR